MPNSPHSKWCVRKPSPKPRHSRSNPHCYLHAFSHPPTLQLHRHMHLNNRHATSHCSSFLFLPLDSSPPSVFDVAAVAACHPSLNPPLSTYLSSLLTPAGASSTLCGPACRLKPPVSLSWPCLGWARGGMTRTCRCVFACGGGEGAGSHQKGVGGCVGAALNANKADPHRLGDCEGFRTVGVSVANRRQTGEGYVAVCGGV